MQHFLSCLLAVLMLCTPLLGSARADEPMPCASNYFHSARVTASASGGGTISMTFSAIGLDVCDRIGVTTYTIERQNDDGSWTTVAGPFGGATASGVVSYSFSRNYTVSANGTYRVAAVFTCAFGIGSEARRVVSNSVVVN